MIGSSLKIVFLLTDGWWASQVYQLIDFVSIIRKVSNDRATTPTIILTSIKGGPINAASSTLSVNTERLDTVQMGNLDILILPPMAFDRLSSALDEVPMGSCHIKRHLGNCGTVIGFSTGVFLLAELGLLFDQVVAIHPEFAKQFSKKYPEVNPNQDSPICINGSLYTCSSASQATRALIGELSTLLPTELLERSLRLANQHHEFNYSPWMASLLKYRKHSDSKVHKVQDSLESDLTHQPNLSDLADRVFLSVSSLKRRFKLATGVSMSDYQQALRVSAMKHSLCHSKQTFESIAHQVGYENSQFARRLFVKQVGKTPKKYRESLFHQVPNEIDRDLESSSNG